MTHTVTVTQDEPQASSPQSDKQDKWNYAVIPVAFAIGYGVTWPLRNIALVYWVYGPAGYHTQGIRLVKSKPAFFSNGEQPPSFPDFVTGMSAVLVAFFAALALVALAKRMYFGYAKRRAA
jgi:hypothetical protein